MIRATVIGGGVLLFASAASAQSVSAPQPVQGTQVAQSAPDVEQRVRALEELVRQLQAEVTQLRGGTARPSGQEAQTPSAQPAQPSPGAPVATSPGLQQPAPPPAASAGKLLNPDIGIIGNFLGAAGTSRGGSSSIAPAPSLTLQESEASFQAIVDPFARADFFLAFGEEGVEVEEGFVTFPALPGGLLLKAGRMRANFGRLNAFHNHTLPWTDRPLVMYNLLGGATDEADTGLKDAGVSVSRLVPAGPLFLEATAEVYRGDSGTLFQANSRKDVSVIGRLRGYADLAESTNLEVGGSFARGHNDLGSSFLTRLYGMDVTLRWKPLRRAIYKSFVARTEFIWSRRDEDRGAIRAAGGFLSADYQFARRWFLGGRIDSSGRARESDVRDRSQSALLTFWPSEFTQLRGQYRRTRYGDRERAANELFFQVLFTIGAHGAHVF